MTATPQPSNPAVSRVTTVPVCEWAMAAIMRSSAAEDAAPEIVVEHGASGGLERGPAAAFGHYGEA